MGSAYEDILKVHWKYHAKRNFPKSLMGRQVDGIDLVQLAHSACTVAETFFQERNEEEGQPENLSVKMAILRRRAAEMQLRQFAEGKRLTPLLERVMAELDGEEWFYFWGLHRIIGSRPLTMEEV